MTRTRGHGQRRLGTPSVALRVVFFLPALLLYGGVYLYPIVSSMTYSFYSWVGITRGDFVGLDNYRRVLSLQPYADQLAAAVLHNLWFFVGTMVLQGGLGLLLALALYRQVRLRRFFQTVYSMPYLMSSLVVGYVWTLLLAPQWGAVNAALTAVGLSDWTRPWLGDPQAIMWVLIVVNCWQWVGAGMLIFGAALGGVPDEQIEAARVDGAGYWQVVRSIQLPQLVPAFHVYTILMFIGAFNVFELVYAVGGSAGGPAGAADMLGTLFYRISFGKSLNALGLSGAMSVLMLGMVLGATGVLTIGFERLRRKYAG